MRRKLTDPTRLADAVLGTWPNLRLWRGTWYVWRDARGTYETLSPDALRKLIYDVARHDLVTYAEDNGGRPAMISARLLNDITAVLRAETLIPDAHAMPCWLPDGGPSDYFIPLSNVLLNTRTWTSSPHDPRWFCDYQLPFPYEPDASFERWLAFLAQTFDGDTELIALLQDLFGYCLTPGNTYERFFYLYGPAASGKSTILGVLRELLGPNNTSSVALEHFGARFGAWPAVGKLANIAGDVGRQRGAEALLKQWTGRDAVTIDRKNLAPLTFCPTTKLVFAGNDLPWFSDRSDGIGRRLVIVPCERSVAEGARDPGLRAALLTELSGIFNWAVAGHQRLVAARAFTASRVAARTLQLHREEMRPEEVFLREETMAAAGSQIPCATTYERYVAWCGERGISDPVNDRWFGRAVRRVHPHTERERRSNGSRSWYYVGVEFIDAVPATEPMWPTGAQA